MDIQKLIDLMDERGLSATKFTRVERTDNKPVAPVYNPASDIVNLFPCLLSVAINDLESTYPDELVDNVTGLVLKQLLPILYEEMPDKEGKYERAALKIMNKFRELDQENPQAFAQIAVNFLTNSLIAYAIATKHGLRSMPTVMGGNGVFRYFAMLSVWDKLTRETQEAVVKDLADQNLWGADPDAL